MSKASLVIGRGSPANAWHLIRFVADSFDKVWCGYRTACCGYRINVGYAMVKQITYGQPTCKNCLAKLAGLRGGPCS